MKKKGRQRKGKRKGGHGGESGRRRDGTPHFCKQIAATVNAIFVNEISQNFKICT